MPKTTLHFQKAGLQTTIQDQGRIGYQSYGVPTSGAMDKKAAQLANELVGNSPENPVIEITLLGPKIQFLGACQIAITGADLSPRINQQIAALYKTIEVKSGDVLKFGGVKKGCRAYLAVGGKWQIPPWLDSFSALPYSGEAATPKSIIKKGMHLEVEINRTITTKHISISEQPQYEQPLRIRVLPGPEFEEFSPYTIAYFFSRGYKITSDSNRMGYRLDANLIDFKPNREVISSGIIPGTIQITSAGQPVILMADAQTVGGYYRIANVVKADLDKLAQLKPGDEVWFSLVRLEEVI
ncbi:MAG: biotin-dependent carboxyltransferase family protein [Bacteroidota bacterium]